MEYGAIDLHLRHSLIRIVQADGSVVLDRRIVTTREALEQVFGARPAMRVLVESGTESEWVAQTLEAYGHAVVVADPNYALMYGHRPRGIKTDKRDVIALAEACRLGIYRGAHRVSGAQRAQRRALRVREQLVRIRTQLINLLRAQLRQEGLRLATGSAERATERLAQLAVPATLATALAPVVTILRAVGDEIARTTRAVEAAAAADPIVARLQTVPGVGPITALSYRAVLDEIGRFRHAGAVPAFLGLIPRENSSGTHRRTSGITKAGPRSLRALLVQASWVIYRGRGGSVALHAWVQRLAARRGRRIAIVALARRLARILFALWRDETVYQAAPAPRAA